VPARARCIFRHFVGHHSDRTPRKSVRNGPGSTINTRTPKGFSSPARVDECSTGTSQDGQVPDIAWLIQSFPNARPVLRSNNRNVQGRMCRQGVGIAVLPRVVGDQIAGIRRMELPKSPPARDIWMGYHRDLRRLQRLRAFISTVSDHLVSVTAR
jgi:DNA-binding transcriptional LysR family regulator